MLGRGRQVSKGVKQRTVESRPELLWSVNMSLSLIDWVPSGLIWSGV